jgi:hypothetical protein
MRPPSVALSPAPQPTRVTTERKTRSDLRMNREHTSPRAGHGETAP